MSHPRTLDCYKMATTAIHQLGDISSDEPDLCHIYGETETDWVGAWVTGLGFFDVKFPKASTRDLTHDEEARYNKMYVQVASHPPVKLNVAARATRRDGAKE